MWHGLGWKARGALDLKVFYAQVKRMIGSDPRVPGAGFMAQCYGPMDRAWRIENWRLPASACAEIGMTFSDLLLAPPYDKTAIASRYKIDVLGRSTVMLSITWHYGGIFAATLICLHDRKRYDAEFIEAIERLAAAHPFVEVRFKDEHPDNLSDLLVADVMVSNLSSFLAYHYVLRRPSVHILPVSEETGLIERRIMLFSRFRLRAWKGTGAAWMLDPHDIGGAAATTADQAIAAVRAALDDPSLGEAATVSWLGRHVTGMDGRTAERFRDEIERFCARALSSGATG
jgi:hypothetical protein